MIIYVEILIGTPFMIVIATVFSCVFFGWTALIGIIAFLSFIPLQVNIQYRKNPGKKIFCHKCSHRLLIEVLLIIEQARPIRGSRCGFLTGFMRLLGKYRI